MRGLHIYQTDSISNAMRMVDCVNHDPTAHLIGTIKEAFDSFVEGRSFHFDQWLVIYRAENLLEIAEE